MTLILLFIQLTFFQPSISDGCLSPEEKKLFSLINEYRKSKGLEQIPFSSSLTQVAQAHVRDLENHFDFNPKGNCNPHSWSENGTWTSCCYTNDHKAAECMWDKPMEIAGYESPGYEIAYFSSSGARAAEGLEGWIRSPSHHPLIINTGIWEQVTWKAVGVGIYGKYAVVWFGQMEEGSSPNLCNQ